MIKLILLEQSHTVPLEYLQQNVGAFKESVTFGATVQFVPISTKIPWKQYTECRQTILIEVVRLFGHTLRVSETEPQEPQLRWFFDFNPDYLYLPTMEDAILLRMSIDL